MRVSELRFPGLAYGPAQKEAVYSAAQEFLYRCLGPFHDCHPLAVRELSVPGKATAFRFQPITRLLI